MKVLIVFAHQEAQSFNAALLARSVAELTALGHTVRISDLYAMRFNPVATAEDFGARRFPDRLQYDREQKYNLQHGALSGDIAAEIEKLLWCDLLILQFPLWWFSVPAIMKGWIDRVFVNGAIYGSGRRYDTGGLNGRRAMVVTSTAAYPGMCASDGLVGALDVVLWPIQNGMLAYAGCKVLPPFVSYSVNFVDEATRHRYLDDYAERLRQLETTEPLFFHPLADFGEDWRLKPGIAARTVGQGKPAARRG
ncbi:NAD(P)H-dependent oxidoreductase [Bradyrhizobium sp. BEA-2-5]|uniref:NAD(P)H-dependent oxidoreductase n=1 Tax=Bradyrhizobium TaxID=374 RepID=UPI00067CAEC0|nr:MULTISPECIES: NAD(P)H-dependent oxidoreductase [Bradyrhizobium]WOH83666.1 NAD(P)H-dependent oxidoreductase [Bradyrhizobium sp. BEA-2-5]